MEMDGAALTGFAAPLLQGFAKNFPPLFFLLPPPLPPSMRVCGRDYFFLRGGGFFCRWASGNYLLLK